MYFAPPNFKTWLRAWWQPKEAKAKAKKDRSRKKQRFIGQVQRNYSQLRFTAKEYCQKMKR